MKTNPKKLQSYRTTGRQQIYIDLHISINDLFTGTCISLSKACSTNSCRAPGRSAADRDHGPVGEAVVAPSVEDHTADQGKEGRRRPGPLRRHVIHTSHKEFSVIPVQATHLKCSEPLCGRQCCWWDLYLGSCFESSAPAWVSIVHLLSLPRP